MSDEEQDGGEKIPMMECTKCKRVFHNDGTQAGGDPFCKHRYEPIAASMTPRDGDAMSNRSLTPARNEVPQFAEPTLPEAAAMHELTHNLQETRKFKNKLQRDLQTLDETLKKCENKLNEEFNQLFEWVTNRKKELAKELKDTYDNRYDLLEEEIDKLTKHENKAKECKRKCHETIQSMDLQDPEREKQVINNCAQCIKTNPTVQEVPIDLEYKFDHMHDKVSKEISKYGQLLSRNYQSGLTMKYTSCNVTELVNPLLAKRDSSPARNKQQQQQAPQPQQQQQQQRANIRIENEKENSHSNDDINNNINSNVNGNVNGNVNRNQSEEDFKNAEIVNYNHTNGIANRNNNPIVPSENANVNMDIDNNNNNNDKNNENEHKVEENNKSQNLVNVPLPILRRVNMRYRPNQNHELKFEPILRDPDEFASNDDEREYDDAKSKYVYLHIQCMGNFDKAKIDAQKWIYGIKRYETYVKLPKPDQKGKYYIDLPNNQFQKKMSIHARARLIFLIDEKAIVDGMVKDETKLIKQSKWSEEKITGFRGADDHVCIFTEINESAISMVPELSPIHQENVNAHMNMNMNMGMNMGMNLNNNGNNAQGVQPGHVSPMGINGVPKNQQFYEQQQVIPPTGIDMNPTEPQAQPVVAAKNMMGGGGKPKPPTGKAGRAKVKCEIIVNGQKPKMKMFAIRPGFTFDDLVNKTRKTVKADQNTNFVFTLRDDPNVIINDDGVFRQFCVESQPDQQGYNAYLKAIQQ